MSYKFQIWPNIFWWIHIYCLIPYTIQFQSIQQSHVTGHSILFKISSCHMSPSVEVKSQVQLSNHTSGQRLQNGILSAFSQASSKNFSY